MEKPISKIQIPIEMPPLTHGYIYATCDRHGKITWKVVEVSAVRTQVEAAEFSMDIERAAARQQRKLQATTAATEPAASTSDTVADAALIVIILLVAWRLFKSL